MALTVRTDMTDFLGTTYGIDSAEAVIDMRPDFAELEPNVAPLTTLLMHPDLGERKAQSVKIEWPEHENLPVTTTTNTNDSGTATATSIACATGTGGYFRINDLIRIESTGELVRVTNVVTDTLTVVRGIGATAVDWGSTDNLTIARVWNNAYQGADTPDIRQVNPVFLYNYTSIVRVPFGETRSAAMTKRFGGDAEARLGKSAQIEAKASVERGLFESTRLLEQVSSRPMTHMGGALYYTSANITTIAGNLTATNVKTAMRSIFQYGSPRKFGFCSPLVMDAFASFSEGKMGISDWAEGDKRFGIKAKKFVNGLGEELILVAKRPWHARTAVNSPAAYTSPSLGGSCVIIDLDSGFVNLRPLLNFTLFKNRHGRGIDGYKHEYIWEGSLEFAHGGSGGAGNGVHGWIRGITGYA